MHPEFVQAGARKAVPLVSNIQAFSTPARTSLPHPAVRLLILGLPDEGAQNRVETQMKITLALVQDKDPDAIPVERCKNADGWLTEEASEQYMRVGSYSHIKLPGFSALKKRNPKHIKQGIPEEETLFVDVEVVACTTGDVVSCCSSCIERERKRSQRKIENRVRPALEVPPDREELEDDFEAKKIVVFNCGQMISFENGEATLPMRITCYCRHHFKEKKGFVVCFRLRNHVGQIVAESMTPPIMITDNHKAKPASAAANLDNFGSTSTSYDTSMSLKAPRRARKGKELPARSSRGKLRADEDDSEEEAWVRKEHEKKPYERPLHAKNNGRKASKLTMTPLNLSKPPSPQLHPLSSGMATPPDFFNLHGHSSASHEPVFANAFASYGSQTSSSVPSPVALRNNTPLPSRGSQGHPALAADSPEASIDSAFSSMFGGGPAGTSATSTMNDALDGKPVLSRVIPSSGPTYGGIEVTILGENFGDRIMGQTLQVMFGDTPATTMWYSSTTLLCTLPPSSTPGPVLTPLTSSSSSLHFKSSDYN
ncbi:hypothetical protein BT69DRAFT_1337109 [Atractiella rhizophila]|nr:hypothetical protein BT69DRAFT_1337109 [Atractiella rhizophila]